MPEQLAVADRERMRYPASFRLGLVGVKEMCDLLRVSQPTLDKIIKDPDERFPTVFFIGRRKYTRLSDLRQWVNGKGRSG